MFADDFGNNFLRNNIICHISQDTTMYIVAREICYPPLSYI